MQWRGSGGSGVGQPADRQPPGSAGAGGQPPVVRLRIGEERVVLVPSRWLPVAAPAAATSPPPVAPLPPAPATPQAPQPPPDLAPGSRPVLVLVEAVPAGAEELAATVLAALAGMGRRCGVVSLERENRLAARLGCTTLAPAWCWRQAAPELVVQQGSRLVITAPSSEDELEAGHVDAVLRNLRDATDALVIDLGCRWVPRLFRPALQLATQIWLVTRTGQWTGAEMRLEQAQLSGWTPMDRVRLVVVGAQTATVNLGVPVIALPDVAAVADELGRVLR